MPAERNDSGAGREAERGVALLVVLATVALLTITIMDFTYETQVGYRRAAHWLKARQAQLMADSGVQLAATILGINSRIKSVFGELGEQADADTITLLDAWAGSCSKEGPPSCPQSITASDCELDFGDGMLAVRVEDESGRFNVNALHAYADCSRPPSQWRQRMLERLLLGEGLDPGLRGAIVDWIDSGDQLYRCGAPGAEAAEYYARELDYGPRNRPIPSLRELAFLEGVGATELGRLRRTLSALPVPTPPTDAGKFNINTAPVAVLMAFDDGSLQPYIGAITNERCLRSFSAADAEERFAQITGDASLANRITDRVVFGSEHFRVRATGRVDDVEQSVEARLQVGEDGVSFEIASYLPRRGPNIAGLDWNEALPLFELLGLTDGLEELR